MNDVVWQPWADVRRDLHKSSFICTQTHFPHLNGNWWMSLWFCHCQPATRGWRCQFVVRCECSWFWRQPRDGVFSFNFLNSYVCLTYIYVYWKVIYELKLIKSWFPVPYGPNPWIVDKGVMLFLLLMCLSGLLRNDLFVVCYNWKCCFNLHISTLMTLRKPHCCSEGVYIVNRILITCKLQKMEPLFTGC